MYGTSEMLMLLVAGENRHFVINSGGLHVASRRKRRRTWRLKEDEAVQLKLILLLTGNGLFHFVDQDET